MCVGIRVVGLKQRDLVMGRGQNWAQNASTLPCVSKEEHWTWWLGVI